MALSAMVTWVDYSNIQGSYMSLQYSKLKALSVRSQTVNPAVHLSRG